MNAAFVGTWYRGLIVTICQLINWNVLANVLIMKRHRKPLYQPVLLTLGALGKHAEALEFLLIQQEQR